MRAQQHPNDGHRMMPGTCLLGILAELDGGSLVLQDSESLCESLVEAIASAIEVLVEPPPQPTVLEKHTESRAWAIAARVRFLSCKTLDALPLSS